MKEGLFLLDSNFQIGTQISSSLESILRRPVKTGTSFREVLRDILPADVFANACDYIALLFSPHIKEGLLGDLNPLDKIEVTLPAPQGKTEQRYLTFYFNRVHTSGKTVHLLVTLFDVTSEVELSRALDDAKEETRMELEGLVSLLRVDPLLLKNFLAQSQVTLLEINDELRSVGGDTGIHPINYRRAVDHVFRKAHTFKGDAAMLGLEIFEALAHKLESALVQIRGKREVHGEDLLSLPFYLEEILQRIGMAEEMMKKLSSYHDTFAPVLNLDTFANSLEQLASRIALEQDKSIKLVTDLKLLSELPPGVLTELKEIAVQLLRNAVVHGIENMDDRQKAGKTPTGNIHIALHNTDKGMYEFSLLDDGRGLIPAKIRSTLLRSGKYTQAQLAELGDKQILMKIFEPGFTTAAHADKHAGHGVGLDVVQKKIENLGASLRIATEKNAYTQFSILFPA